MSSPTNANDIHLDFPTTMDTLLEYTNMPSACLQDGHGLFHEAVYAKILDSQRREKLSNSYFFSVEAIRQQEVGRGERLGAGLVEGCTSCPPRRGLASDPLRMDRRYQQWGASRGSEGLESLMTPWEQHDAGTGIMEVKLRPRSLPSLPMRRNHVVFTVKSASSNSGEAGITCVMGGTLHPECEVPMEVRGETREEQMPFVYASTMSESWNRHYPLHGKDDTIPPNIHNGCTVGYNHHSCPGKVFLLIQEPIGSGGGFEDKLVCMEATFDNHHMLTIIPTWTTILKSTTLQDESTEPTRPFHPTERFVTVDSYENKDRIHVTQVAADGVAVYEWTVGDVDGWKLRGKVANKSTTPSIRGVAGAPVYDSNNILIKIRVFAQCLGEDEMWFIPRTDKSQGGFRARLGNVLRATAAGSDPLFEVCPLSLKTLDVEPLLTSTTPADSDYSQLHAPRDVSAALELQDEIYDRPVEEPTSGFTSPVGSWTFSAQSSSDQLPSYPDRSSTGGATWGASKSSTMGDRLLSGGTSDNQQPTDIFYQLVEEVDNRSTSYLKARTLQRQLMTIANGIIDVASATGAPLHICAGMTCEQFQQRVIRPMRQFLRCMSRGGYSFESMDDPIPDATKQRPSHTRGVNANFVQPSDLTHRWAITVRGATTNHGLLLKHPSPPGDRQADVLMLGIAKKEETRQRGMLASRCPEASNSSSLKSIAAQWISTASK